jgi:hypothetical protein
MLQDIAQLAMSITEARIDLDRFMQLGNCFIAFSYGIKRKC